MPPAGGETSRGNMFLLIRQTDELSSIAQEKPWSAWKIRQRCSVIQSCLASYSPRQKFGRRIFKRTFFPRTHCYLYSLSGSLPCLFFPTAYSL